MFITTEYRYIKYMKNIYGQHIKMYKGERFMWQTLRITDVKKKLRTNFEHGLSDEEVRKKI